jgi:hypothetical protein
VRSDTAAKWHLTAARRLLQLERARGRPVLLWGLLVLISAGLVLYSQTKGFVWDEGFHLVTAQLIDAGRKPYIDFCFPQTPLNAYWNAGLMWLFGQTWRVTHVFAALEVAVAVFLTVDFIFSRFPVRRWRFASAVTIACFVGLNTTLVQFGTVAQAYGAGVLLTVAAFRAAIASVGREGIFWPFAAGLLGGAAAACTLLTAPIVPVLLLWMLVYNAAGDRRLKGLAFTSGALVPFAPVFWLFMQGPHQAFFNVVQYQALYRRVHWDGATEHDVDVLSAWLDSTQALATGLLAIAGAHFVWKRSGWEGARRAEFYLAAWLAIAFAIYISTAHPTFERYFVFMAPFVSVLAIAGLYAIASQFGRADRPALPAFIAAALVVLYSGKTLFDDRDSVKWKDYEQIAKKVDEVTPRKGTFFADELVYFLLQRTPPSGMEFSYAHKLELPPAEEALFHVVSQAELKKQVVQGRFDTVETCKDDIIDDFELPKLFSRKADIGDCSIFWSRRSSAR